MLAGLRGPWDRTTVAPRLEAVGQAAQASRNRARPAPLRGRVLSDVTAKPKRTTLRDVAERAGVSLGTASNAFNRPELLTEALRARVRAAAEELAYTGPDPAARRLRTGRSGALGVIFTGSLPFAFGDVASTLFLGGLANVIEETGAGLLVIPDSSSRDVAADVVRNAVVDGFIAYSTPTGDPRVEAALARAIPIVVVDQPTDLAAPFIGIDDRAAARGAAEHLRGLRHRRVAVLAFAGALDAEGRLPFELTEQRRLGYRDGLGDAFDPELVVRAKPNVPETGRTAVAELLARPDPPTAVLAMSDALAIGALQAARDLDRDVPGELSVVGFDDSPVAALSVPALTSVAQPLERKGELAAQTLLDLLAGDAPAPERVLLDTELVVRDSTGPPA